MHVLGDRFPSTGSIIPSLVAEPSLRLASAEADGLSSVFSVKMQARKGESCDYVVVVGVSGW
jgi:hypothetical protein